MIVNSKWNLNCSSSNNLSQYDESTSISWDYETYSESDFFEKILFHPFHFLLTFARKTKTRHAACLELAKFKYTIFWKCVLSFDWFLHWQTHMSKRTLEISFGSSNIKK